MRQTEAVMKQTCKGTSALEPPSAFMNPVDQVKESNSPDIAFKKKFDVIKLPIESPHGRTIDAPPRKNIMLITETT